MHKLASKPITKDCFKYDNSLSPVIEMTQNQAINLCENLRQLYIETKDKAYWCALVQLLPQGWLQTRTVTMSYANLRNIYFQRRNHKLKEWHEFCNWISKLPYGGELIMLEENNEIN